ncbi:MAG: hypothetical protein HYU57_07170 [Micavibrio aeruginosavorus]|nr:hypothetical protein [Micavibrio aeruginosavorus]
MISSETEKPRRWDRNFSAILGSFSSAATQQAPATAKPEQKPAPATTGEKPGTWTYRQLDLF